MDNLNYLAPESFDQAVIAKSQHAENSRVIAGGTDLLLRMRDKVVAPSVLIDLRHTSLNKILVSNDAMSLGASVSLSQILENSEITQHFPALQTACREFAGPPIRNRATLGGNIVNASPAADLVPPLIAYDASIVLRASGGDRALPLAEFFTGPGQSVIAPDEILMEIRIPLLPPLSAATFIKLGQRRSMAISQVNLTTRLSIDNSNCVTGARIVLGAVAPTPIRAHSAEEMLAGKIISEDLIRMAAEKAREEVTPISDVRASLEYRLEMTEVLVRRALFATWKKQRRTDASG